MHTDTKVLEESASIAGASQVWGNRDATVDHALAPRQNQEAYSFTSAMLHEFFFLFGDSAFGPVHIQLWKAFVRHNTVPPRIDRILFRSPARKYPTLRIRRHSPPPHLHLRRSQFQPPRNPFQGLQGLHEPLKTHLLPYLHQHTSVQRNAWST